MKLILFREGEVIKHPDTGRVLGADTETLGEARVEEVSEDVLASDSPSARHVSGGETVG